MNPIRKVQQSHKRRGSGSVNAWLIVILLVLTVLLFFKMMDGIPTSLLNPDAAMPPLPDTSVIPKEDPAAPSPGLEPPALPPAGTPETPTAPETPAAPEKKD